MYCPRCGIQTTDSATFCRGCGFSLSLVSQALTGNLAGVPTKRDDDHKQKKPPNLAEAFTTIFSALGFVLMALASLFFAPAGRIWWYWVLIPAFPLFGKGIAMLVELKLGQRRAAAPQLPAPLARNTGEPAAGDTHRIAPPPSVVEATTRQLDRRHE
jgi:hypothetical protein